MSTEEASKLSFKPQSWHHVWLAHVRKRQREEEIQAETLIRPVDADPVSPGATSSEIFFSQANTLFFIQKGQNHANV